jgi:hypothetical protein
MSVITQQATAIQARRMRREGWLLIAAFAAGLLIIVIQSVFYADLDAQLVARAAELGHRPPLEEYSRIQAQFAGNALVEVLGQLLFGLPPFALLALAVASIRHRLQGGVAQRLGSVAWWCALGALAAWIIQLYLDLSVKFGPGHWWPFGAWFDLLYSPFAFATAFFGLGAVSATALVLRRQGITPWMALAALIVAALLAVANAAAAIATSFAAGLPPLIPLIPALMLGLGLMRARQA